MDTASDGPVAMEPMTRRRLGSWPLLLLLSTLGLLVSALVVGEVQLGNIAVFTWIGVTALLGAVIVWRAGSPLGWILLWAMTLAAFGTFAEDFTGAAVAAGRSDEIVTAAAWLAHWARLPAMGAFVFLFLLFPTGRLPDRRWRWAAAVSVLGVALITIGVALTPGPMAGQPAIENPAGIGEAAPGLELIQTVGSALLIAGVIAACASLLFRLRRAQGDERHQVKWLLYAAALLIVTGAFAMITEGALNEFSFIALLAGLFGFPVALTIALTRYRLYDIDLVVNRTIVYTGLTASVVVIYILIVGVSGSLLQQRVGLVPALVATGVVAVIFQPLRRGAQEAVDRIMFGERRDPYGALTGLASTLQSTLDPDQVLPTIVETLSRSLKLAYVGIESEGEGGVEFGASTGDPGSGDPESIPLVYQGAEVGRLVVIPRRGDVLGRTDRSLIMDLAKNAGAAVHGVALTEALRRSRNDLLAAREEERRRLRRDLHDGLGPELAGIALGVGAARNLAVQDAEAAEALLGRVQAQADAAARSVRGLVDGLRPAALDDLGLIETVRQKVTGLLDGSDIRFDMIAPSTLLPLPAAVEVAALRIALEAVTNVVRHSEARRCSLGIQISDGLRLEVTDDGRGIGRANQGVGLGSMRERAEEVGGSFAIETVEGGGTRMVAVLPIR